MDREARIKLIAEGAGRAASDVRGVAAEVGKLGAAAGGAQKALTDIGKSMYRMASDAARAANDVKPISFQAAADSAKKFDEVVTRLAVRSNRDIGQLKQTFRDTGKEIGVLPDRVANAARALTKMTGSSAAAEAMAAIGAEANDTDRSLEEMSEIGAELYNKLGVPLDKIGDAFKRIRGVAADFSTIGGHVALEDTLTRLAPLLAHFQTNVTRAAATVAVLGQGKSKEVGERTTGTILSALSAADPLLVTKTLRQITGNKDYQPYVTNEQGEDVLKKEAMGLLQKRLKKVPFGAALRFFGNNVTATRTFRDTDLSIIDKAEKQTEDTKNALLGEGAIDLDHLRPSDRTALDEYNKKVLREKAAPSGYAATMSGERDRVDAERDVVSGEAGDLVQAQRDKRNRMYAGQRRQQAGIDTLKAYLPDYLERPLDLAEAAAADNASRVGSIPKGQSRADRIVVDLSQNSIRGVADAIKSSPPVVRTGSGPAAQAVESSKAQSRGAANF